MMRRWLPGSSALLVTVISTAAVVQADTHRRMALPAKASLSSGALAGWASGAERVQTAHQRRRCVG